jgi:S-formylglutathione hydrolase
MFDRGILRLGLLILLFGISASAQELTLEQILKKNEEALGGVEALKNIQSLQITQKTESLQNTLSLKQPDCMRSDMSSTLGMHIITARYGRSQWTFNPLDEPKFQMRERQMFDGWVESEIASRIHWLAGIKIAGGAVELLGKETVNNTPVFKLKVTPKNGESTSYYLDANTFLPAKIFSRMEAGERFMESERYPADFKKVGGVLFAHSVLISYKSSEWAEQKGRENYEFLVNAVTDDSIFKAPTEDMLAEMTRGMTLKGKLDTLKVHGESLVGNLIGDSPDRAVTVYLPPSYDKEPTRRYPVVYMLHGFGIDNDGWTRPVLPNNVTIPAEKAFAAGAREMILVIPSALTAFQGSMYSSSVTTGDWESFIAQDLVSYIDSHYRTIPERASRGLAGHSMGGYGAFRIGMKHPEVFSSLYSMSPCCMPPTMNPQAPLMLQVAAIKDLKEIGKANFAVQAMMASAAAWSPNPKRPPYYLDLPIENGKQRPEIIAKWAANAPLTMVHQYIPNLKKYRAIAFDIGDKDIVVAEVIPFFSKNLAFSAEK